MKTIGIIGLGVMGGSFAARCKELGYKVDGIDIDPKTIQYALDHQIIDKGSVNCEDLIGECDILVFCLYPTKIKPWLEKYQDLIKPGCILMEISGVKENIAMPLQEILRKDVELISVHPMCGRESQGIEYSTPRIFDQANFIITPTNSNTYSNVVFVSSFAKELGCKNISVLSMEEHDKMIGFLSQLTHVIAVSLMNTHENTHLVEYTGDSFRDLTRIAKINENMWSELFILNKDILLDEISQFISSITHFKEALEKEDEEEMKRLFTISTARRKCFDL